MQMLGSAPPVLAYAASVHSYDESQDKLDFNLLRPRLGSKVSVELSQALQSLPLRPPQLDTAPPFSAKHVAYTKSFSGVRPEDLPLEMTDNVDVDVVRCRDVTESEVRLEALSPDLPGRLEEIRRNWKAIEFEREEAVRLFEDTKAQL
jgi:hypothetical protein